MSVPPNEREKGRCLECGAPFLIERDFASRNATIRYCDTCKKKHENPEYYPNKGGAPKRISKFSKSGTVSLTCD